MTTDENTPGGQDAPSRDLAFEALVAADPASSGAPDLARLRAAVAATVADEGAYAEPAPCSDVPEAVTYEVDDVAIVGGGQRRVTDDVPAPPGEPVATPAAAVLEPRPRGRAARALQVAAAGLAVLAVGAGGFLVGQRTPDSSDTGVIAAVGGPARLESGGGRDGVGSAATTDSAAATDAMAYSDGGYGRAVFTGSGLSDSPGSATAWGFDVAAVYSKESIEHLAAVLGVEGEAQQDGSWRVGSWDLPGPTVSVEPDGTGYFYYDHPDISPYQCYEQAFADDGNVSRERTQECAIRMPEITTEQAEAQVREVLGELGVDVGALTFTATAESMDFGGESGGVGIGSVWVSAVPTAGPLGSDLGGDWSAGVTGAGIWNLSGSLAPLVDLGEYPTVSPAEAVERLMDPRFGSEMTSWATYEVEGTWTPRTSAPTTPTAGAAIEWPVENITIVGSKPAYLSSWTRDDATVLLPAYELSAADGRSWTVLAVAESALDLTAR